MGLLTETVKITWQRGTCTHFKKLGYKFTHIGDEFEVKVEELSPKSDVLVDVQCDECGEILKPMRWNAYKKSVKEDEKYYCRKCALKLYGTEKYRISRLKNSENSFKKWCIEHNRQDILDRWDYELNKYKPDEISSSTNKKFYFKCPKKIHESELKNINSFTSGHQGSMDCRTCNSFAQWGIDNIGQNFFDKYWDYCKNIDKNDNPIDPWKINKCSPKTKIWIKCQEKDYHKSYLITCNNFVNEYRCPYCTNRGGKVHPKDSLGQYIIDNYGQEFLDNIWSKKNKKSPYEYTPVSGEKIWWKCLDTKHEDFTRRISNSNYRDFRCPECQYSKGEQKIEEYLMNNKFVRDTDYIPQKEFDGLVGIGNGNLSYDFYLLKYNLLIEYQGEFHDEGAVTNQTKKQLKYQQEHDRRKKQYAIDNNIKLLEIWYWDFDNIDSILDKELKQHIKH